jgi:hypothetical protein
MSNNNLYYTTSGIYGVKMYTYTNKESNILFKQQQNTLITNVMMEEAKEFYKNLDENNKNNVKFQIYRKCNSIEYNDVCMIWWDISLNKFINDFCI